MIQIIQNKETGRWSLIVDGEVLSNKYSSSYQASKKLYQYLKGQK